MSVLTTWQTERRVKYSTNGQRKTREPLITVIIRGAAKILPRFSSFRKVVLCSSGVALIDLGAWQFTTAIGFFVTGLSLFLLDWMTS